MKRNNIKKAQITATSVPNFYDVVSSNNFDHYPLLLTGPGTCLCGCPSGSAHRDCYHRSFALRALEYIPVIEDTLSDIDWQRIEIEADWADMVASVRELFEDGPSAA